MLKWEFDFGPVRFAVSAFPPAGVVGEAVGCTRWTQGRLGLGADMRDLSAWRGGTGEGARRGGRGSECGCENQGSCPAALGEGGGREDGPAATRPLPRRR